MKTISITDLRDSNVYYLSNFSSECFSFSKNANEAACFGQQDGKFIGHKVAKILNGVVKVKDMEGE
ncbi:hypothetical protein [Secundilactobacillus collinoides]|uniref:Uncharacterized protein n=2 Tax=Secundilactobacillus collinoides TaxID=33960 RepID=A0A0R2B5Q9_SECCO|nr:hypothetical protein [Secundilactobacillus collinoides]KRM74034.1 hypothetical protein FC82_GL000806 [Secundilactobacillus collinoides DSM 20515 = JCM 1123]